MNHFCIYIKFKTMWCRDYKFEWLRCIFCKKEAIQFPEEIYSRLKVGVFDESGEFHSTGDRP